MSNPVVIKSYKGGIAVYLDEVLAFDQLLAEVSDKFRDSARFFGEARVAISFEKRVLSDEEENALVDAISRNTGLHIICVVGKDPEKEAKLKEAAETFERYFPRAEQNSAQFYRGNLNHGQILETEGSIVIIGDVQPGCSVISARDIIVIGKLLGNAYAGGDMEEGHFIVALEMAPQKCKIGAFKYKAKEKPRWQPRMKKTQPQIAVVENGEVHMKGITNELLNELMD